MRRIQNHNALWQRLFCLLMAFYVINVSIDAPDGYVQPNARGEYHEDLSFNEIESFSELVLEGILGIQNAIPERDESNEEENQLTKIFFDWSVPAPAVTYQFTPSVSCLTATVLPFTAVPYCSKTAEINTPPPQQV